MGLEQITDNFAVTLQDSLKAQYNCFRTEVRDTGIFVCGVHKSGKWLSATSECPDIYSIVSQAIYSLYDAIETGNLPTKSSASSQYEDDDFQELF